MMPGRTVQFAGACDQAQRGLLGFGVDALRGKAALPNADRRIHDVPDRRATLQPDRDQLAYPRLSQAVEDSRSASSGHVTNNDRRARLSRLRASAEPPR